MAVGLIPWRFFRLTWLLPAGVGFLVLAAALWPVMAGLQSVPAGKTYLWTNIPDVEDTEVYLAFLEENGLGRWRYRNLFTSEPQIPALVHPLWAGLGLWQRFTGQTAGAVFTVSRVVFGAILLWTLGWALRQWIQEPWIRRAAFGLMVLGPGLGGLVLLVRFPHDNIIDLLTRPPTFVQLPADLIYPHISLLQTLWHSPLLIAAQLLIISVLAWFRQSLQHPGKIWLAGAAFLLLVWIHPYDAVPVLGTLLVWLLLRITLEPGFDPPQTRRFLRQVGILSAWAIGPLLYYSWLLIANPVIRAWDGQNTVPTAHGWTLIVGVLPLLLLAIFGRKKFRQPAQLFFIAWVAALAVLAYVPHLRFQSKMLIGIFVPLSVLAATGAKQLFMHPRPWMRFIAYGMLAAVLAAMITSQAGTIHRLIRSVQTETNYHYANTETLMALRWMGDHTPGDSVVLARYRIGHLVPHYAHRAAYIGHPYQTIDFRVKWDRVNQFFSAATSDAERGQFVYAASITHLVLERPERARLGWTGSLPAWLRIRREQGGTMIAEVVPATVSPR